MAAVSDRAGMIGKPVGIFIPWDRVRGVIVGRGVRVWVLGIIGS